MLTLECASTGGRGLPLLGKFPTDKEIAIGVVNHATAAVEPPERLILSTDCGFGREGLSRRIAFYKAVAINLGANIVRRELKLTEAEIPAAIRAGHSARSARKGEGLHRLANGGEPEFSA